MVLNLGCNLEPLGKHLKNTNVWANLWRLWFNWPEVTPPHPYCLRSFLGDSDVQSVLGTTEPPCRERQQKPLLEKRLWLQKPPTLSDFRIQAVFCLCLSPHHFMCSMLCMDLSGSNSCHFRKIKKKSLVPSPGDFSSPTYLSVSDTLFFYLLVFLISALPYDIMASASCLLSPCLLVSTIAITVPLPGWPEEGSKCLCQPSFNRECLS